MPKKKIKYRGDDDERNSVYMYHNEKYDMHFYTYADGWDQAMMKFDLINFPNRDDWKIYVACGQQPTGSKR